MSMPVTKEFMQAIEDRNILRIRLMMKNSLLLDASFNDFRKMEKIAMEHGVDVWQHTSKSTLSKRKEPWSRDDMNYELTSIVNDFTKEHMQYLMEIIKELYHGSSNTTKPKEATLENSDHVRRDENSSNKPRPQSKNLNIMNGNKSRFEKLVDEITSMSKLLNENRKDLNKCLSSKDIDNINWNNKVISQLREHAQNIIDFCDKIKGRNSR